MKQYEITITKNLDTGNSYELFWLPIDNDTLIHVLLGINNVLMEELDECRNRQGKESI